MKAQEFSGRWKQSPLIRFSLANEAAKGLSDATAAALREFGLPKNAEPWLSFMEFLKTDDATAAVLEKHRFYPIGYLANGDLICVDKASDRVMICDHEDPNEAWMLNSSLDALYECIVIFDRFIAEVNRRNPRYASDFKIPDGMLGELEAQLIACDAQAIAEKGFWFCEIQALDDSVF